MPIYEYRCSDGHNFEVLQSMTDDPATACTICGKPVQRVFHPVAVHFKGSGFYTTDYGRGNRSGSADSSDASAAKKDSSSDSSSDSGDGAKKDKAKEKTGGTAEKKASTATQD